ncbi:MAG: tail fiber domain-containing protein [Bacteroidales bacterium]|nr:tail fiber domain-containing protein [Bacteroidales bacterium]
MKKFTLLALTAFSFVFGAEAQLKMNLTGNVVIGSLSADPACNLEVMGDSYFSCHPASGGFYFTNASATGVLRPQWNNSACLGLPDAKLWRAYTFSLHSDRLFQSGDSTVTEHIRPIEDPVGKISGIRGVVYDLKRDYFQNSPADKIETLVREGSNQTGFIAQELMTVLPDLVKFNEDSDLYEVDYTGLIPIMIEAIKVQQAEIVRLNEKIVALAGQL